MKTVFLIGRIAFGGFFLYSGINHIAKRKQLAQYAAMKNVPNPDLAVLLSGAALVYGGACILLGVQPKLGSTAIAGFLGAVSPMMHDFWNQTDDQARTNEMTHFMKNMALLGAALSIMGIDKPWPLALAAAE